MTKREQRVIRAFENCVRSGEFTEDYAVTLIEDNQRYGWLTEEAKEAFYTFLDGLEAERAAAEAALRKPAPAPAPSGSEDEGDPAEDAETPAEAAEPATEGDAQDGEGE